MGDPTMSPPPVSAVNSAGTAASTAPRGYSTWSGSLMGGTVTATPSEMAASGKAQWTVTVQRADGSSATTQVWLSQQFSAAQLTQGSAAKSALERQLNPPRSAGGAITASRPSAAQNRAEAAASSETAALANAVTAQQKAIHPNHGSEHVSALKNTLAGYSSGGLSATDLRIARDAAAAVLGDPKALGTESRRYLEDFYRQAQAKLTTADVQAQSKAQAQAQARRQAAEAGDAAVKALGQAINRFDRGAGRDTLNAALAAARNADKSGWTPAQHKGFTAYEAQASTRLWPKANPQLAPNERALARNGAAKARQQRGKQEEASQRPIAAVGAQAPDGRGLQGDLVWLDSTRQWGLKGTTQLYRMPASVQLESQAAAYARQQIKTGGWTQLRSLDPRYLGGQDRGKQTAQYLKGLRQRVDIAAQEVGDWELTWAELANSRNNGQKVLDVMREAFGDDASSLAPYERTRSELQGIYQKVFERRINVGEGQRQVQALMAQRRAQHQQRIARFGGNAETGAAVAKTTAQLSSTTGAWIVGGYARVKTGSPAAAAAAAAGFSASNRALQNSLSWGVNNLAAHIGQTAEGPDKDLIAKANPLTRERLLEDSTGVATDAVSVFTGMTASKYLAPLGGKLVSLAAPLVARAAPLLAPLAPLVQPVATKLAPLVQPLANKATPVLTPLAQAAQQAVSNVATRLGVTALPSASEVIGNGLGHAGVLPLIRWAGLAPSSVNAKINESFQRSDLDKEQAKLQAAHPGQRDTALQQTRQQWGQAKNDWIARQRVDFERQVQALGSRADPQRVQQVRQQQYKLINDEAYARFESGQRQALGAQRSSLEGRRQLQLGQLQDQQRALGEQTEKSIADQVSITIRSTPSDALISGLGGMLVPSAVQKPGAPAGHIQWRAAPLLGEMGLGAVQGAMDTLITSQVTGAPITAADLTTNVLSNMVTLPTMLEGSVHHARERPQVRPGNATLAPPTSSTTLRTRTRTAPMQQAAEALTASPIQQRADPAADRAPRLDPNGSLAHELFRQALETAPPSLYDARGFASKDEAFVAVSRVFDEYNRLRQPHNGGIELTAAIFSMTVGRTTRFYSTLVHKASVASGKDGRLRPVDLEVPYDVDARMVNKREPPPSASPAERLRVPLPPQAVVVAMVHSHPPADVVSPVAGPSLDDVTVLLQRARVPAWGADTSYIVQRVQSPRGPVDVAMQLELKPAYWLAPDNAALADGAKKGVLDINDWVMLRYVARPGDPPQSPVPLNVTSRDKPSDSFSSHLLPQNVVDAAAESPLAPLVDWPIARPVAQDPGLLPSPQDLGVELPYLERASRYAADALRLPQTVLRRYNRIGMVAGTPFARMPTRQEAPDHATYVQDVQNWHRSLLTTLDFLLKQQRGGNDLLIADPVSGERWSLRETVDGLRAELPRVQALSEAGTAQRPRASKYTDFYRTLLDDVTRPLTGALMDPQLAPRRRAQITQAISDLYTQFGRELVEQRLLGEDHNSAERRLKAGFIGSPAHHALEARIDALGHEFAAEIAAGRQRNPYGVSGKADIAVTRQLDDLVRQLTLGAPRSADAYFAEASPLRADGTRAAVHFVGIAQSGATTAAIVAQLARGFGWGGEIGGHLGYLIPSKRESGAESRATEFVSTLDAQQIAPGDMVVLVDNTLVSGNSAQTALRALDALHGPGRVNVMLAVAYPRNKTSIEAGTRSIPVWGLLDGRQVFAPGPRPSGNDPKPHTRAAIATENHEPLEPRRERPRAQDFTRFNLFRTVQQRPGDRPAVELDARGLPAPNGLGKQFYATMRDPASGRDVQLTVQDLQHPAVVQHLAKQGIRDPMQLEDGRLLMADRQRLVALKDMVRPRSHQVFVRMPQPVKAGGGMGYTYAEMWLLSRDLQREVAPFHSPGRRSLGEFWLGSKRLNAEGQLERLNFARADSRQRQWYLSIGPVAPQFRDSVGWVKTVRTVYDSFRPFHTHPSGGPPSARDLEVQPQEGRLERVAMVMPVRPDQHMDAVQPYVYGGEKTPPRFTVLGSIRKAVESVFRVLDDWEVQPSDGPPPEGGAPNGLRATWARKVTQGVKTIEQARAVYFRERAAYYRSGVNPALANRRAFLDGLLQDDAGTVEFIEIPGLLKPINDHLGHGAADKLLVQVLDAAADVRRQLPWVTVFQFDALRLGSKGGFGAFGDAFAARMKGLQLEYVAGGVVYSNRTDGDAPDPLVREGLPVVRVRLDPKAAGSPKELLAQGIDALDRASEPLKQPEAEGGTGELDPERGAHLRKLKQAPASANDEPLWVNDPGLDPARQPKNDERRATQQLSAAMLDALQAQTDRVIGSDPAQLPAAKRAIEDLVFKAFSTDESFGRHLGNQLAFDRAESERKFHFIRTLHGFVDVGAVGVTNRLVSRFGGDAVLTAVHATAAEVARRINKRMELAGGKALEVFAVGGDEIRFISSELRVLRRFEKAFTLAMQEATIEGIAGDTPAARQRVQLSDIPVYIGIGKTKEQAEARSNAAKAGDPERVPGQLPPGYRVSPLGGDEPAPNNEQPLQPLVGTRLIERGRLTAEVVIRITQARRELATEVGQQPQDIILDIAVLKVGQDYWTARIGHEADAFERARGYQSQFEQAMAPLRQQATARKAKEGELATLRSDYEQTLAAIQEVKPDFDGADIGRTTVGEVTLQQLEAAMPPADHARLSLQIARQYLDHYRAAAQPTSASSAVQRFLSQVEPNLRARWEAQLVGGAPLHSLLLRQAQAGQPLDAHSVDPLVALNEPVLRPPQFVDPAMSLLADSRTFEAERGSAYELRFRRPVFLESLLAAALQELPFEPMQIRTADNTRRFDVYRHAGQGQTIIDQSSGDALPGAQDEPVQAVIKALGIGPQQAGALVVSYGDTPAVISDDAVFYWTQQQIDDWLDKPPSERSPVTPSVEQALFTVALKNGRETSPEWRVDSRVNLDEGMLMLHQLGIEPDRIDDNSARHLLVLLRDQARDERQQWLGRDNPPQRLLTLADYIANLQVLSHNLPLTRLVDSSKAGEWNARLIGGPSLHDVLWRELQAGRPLTTDNIDRAVSRHAAAADDRSA
jgi:hypothetical protein